MAKAGERIRQQATAQRRAFLKDNWFVLLQAAGICAAVAVFAAIFWWYLALPKFSDELRPVAAGFLGGVILSSYGWSLGWILREVDGTAYLRLAAESEAFTSDALRYLKKFGWYVEDNIEFDGYDVDHVAVGPPGVYVFETKYTSMAWKLTPSGLVGPYRDPVRQACSSADSIRRLLRSRGVIVEVTPVIAVWGRRMQDIDGGAKALPAGPKGEKVTIVKGRQQSEWVPRMAEAPARLDVADVEAVREVLQDFKKAKAGRAADGRGVNLVER